MFDHYHLIHYQHSEEKEDLDVRQGNNQSLDEVEQDFMNYQNQHLSYLLKCEGCGK